MATFRSIFPPHSLYTPEFDFDVIAMRKHPEYEEIDSEGNKITQPEEGVQRPMMAIPNLKSVAPDQRSRAKTRGKRK